MSRQLVMFALIATLAGAFGLGCETTGGGDREGAIAARIGDDVLTVEELDAEIKEKLFARESRDGNASRLYDLRISALQDVLAERLVDAEAEKRGITREEFVAQEFPAPEIDEQEIVAFYHENVTRLRGMPLEQVQGDIRSYLEDQARAKAIETYVAEHSEIVLERARITLRPGGPSRGPDDAPVTIVEFSDFQCPFCQRADPVLKEIVRRHPKDVRVVYRHLPLDSIHPPARPSAEAAACAEEGGKFWEYHDVLFANNRALGPEDLKRYAEEVGLEAESFEECMETRRHAAAVQADVLEAQSIGITGTPAFVVNGVVLFGLKSVEEMDELVREELAGAENES
jgi:protein-disulfide isomerase